MWAKLRQREDLQKDQARANELALRWLGVGSLLPVGRADARFYLALAPEGATSRLSLLLRTAEESIKENGPSANALMLPLSHPTAAVLAEEVRARGVPRLEVVRLVDMGEHVGPMPWPLLVFRYGNWLQVMSINGGRELILVDGADRDNPLSRLIRQRLWPDDPFGLDALPHDEALATHCLDQLDEDTEGNGFASTWVMHVRGLAGHIINRSERPASQCRAATMMLEALSYPPALAAALSAQEFERLTPPADRLDIARALFRTGRSPGEDAWLDQRAGAVAARGFDVFEHRAWGWDVRAACQGAIV
jgi:hypothetical protein